MTTSTDDPASLESESKRNLLKATAAVAVASALPSWLGAEAAGNAGYDVIVIGGGTAGIPLALFAAERGASVLIIEKAPVLGGTLDRSYASTAAAGSVLQKAAGITDSPDAHYDDIMRSVRNTADPVMVRLWTDNAADTVDWLVKIGVKFSSVPTNSGSAADLQSTYRTPRMQMVDGRGRALIRIFEPLIKKIASGGKLTVSFNSRVVQLIQDNVGAVVGATMEDSTGRLRNVMGRNVVLTAGGCAANPILFQELHNFPLYFAAGYPFNQGDGLLLGQSVGGYLWGAQAYIPRFGLVMSDNTIPSTPTDGTYQETMISSDIKQHPPWGIWVNAHGERFTQEDSLIQEEREYALKVQPGHRFWLVHDQEAFEKAPSPMQGWSRERYASEFSSNPMFFKAQTIRQLGLKAGVNPGSLLISVDEYNSALRNNAPDRFGRTVRPAPIARAPFYAVQYQGFAQQSFAGLAVDYKLRVVRQDGSPVQNLFAAGEILGSTAVGNPAHAGGSLVTPALTFGRLLGQRILDI